MKSFPQQLKIIDAIFLLRYCFDEDSICIPTGIAGINGTLGRHKLCDFGRGQSWITWKSILVGGCTTLFLPNMPPSRLVFPTSYSISSSSTTIWLDTDDMSSKSAIVSAMKCLRLTRDCNVRCWKHVRILFAGQPNFDDALKHQGLFYGIFLANTGSNFLFNPPITSDDVGLLYPKDWCLTNRQWGNMIFPRCNFSSMGFPKAVLGAKHQNGKLFLKILNDTSVCGSSFSQ